jgi:diguanylate cyclase (GGDEF)-like protein
MARERDEAKEHQKDLTRVRKKDANYLAELVELGIALSASQGREELNQKILMAARNFTNADGGSLYLVNREESELHFRIMVNDTLETFFVSGRESEKPFPPLQLMNAMEDGKPLSLVLLDIDHFKKFNDTYGHLIGDQVIRLIAESLKRNVKGQDTAARYGGEEFAIILPNTLLGNAVMFGNQLRRYIESHKVVSKSGNTTIGKVTASFGVAEFRPGEPVAKLIERADKALYLAKENGRNLVVGEQQLEGNDVVSETQGLDRRDKQAIPAQ